MHLISMGSNFRIPCVINSNHLFLYRPHDKPPTKEQLDKINYIPKENLFNGQYRPQQGIHGGNLSWLEIKRKYNQSNRNHRSYY